jgi:hypothetical protein
MIDAADSASNLTRVSVARFLFFMKAIAEDDLWTEVELCLEQSGCAEVSVSFEPVEAIKELLRAKAARNEPLGERSQRVMACVCGPGGPPGAGPPIKSPPPPPPPTTGRRL